MKRRLGARSRAAAAAFAPPAPSLHPPFGMGHNQGPPLGGGGRLRLWRKAQAKVWKAPPPEVLRRRIAMAEACGLTYREYALELLERGRWLTPEADAFRIAQIIAVRSGR